MLETLRNAWKIKEIRNKILFTVFIVLIFRIGSVIPVPYIDVAALKSATNREQRMNFSATCLFLPEAVLSTAQYSQCLLPRTSTPQL